TPTTIAAMLPIEIARSSMIVSYHTSKNTLMYKIRKCIISPMAASARKTSQNGSPQRGKPKGDKRARTRAALIEAAAQVIGEKGYERTSLEEVAARAGMTRGAIYGNFSSKDELLMAFVESRWQPAAPPLKPGAPLKEQLRIIAR